MIEQLTEMPTYEAYKDSGVEWLGEIPAHWQQNRFKFVGSASKGKLPKRIVSIESADLPAYMTMDYLRGGQANQWVLDSNLEVIEYDEVLLLWDGSNSGEFLKSKKGVISSTVALIKFRGVLKQFGWYFSSVIERRLRTSTVGMGIPHVNGQELINCELLIPTVPEQLAITAYLDNKTAQIDQAMAIKEQQIALLKEHKQILIQNAVTRGLDPNVPMRDSGVEWIGEIPAHWVAIKLSHIAKIDSGATPDRSRQDFWNGKIPWVKTGEINYNEILETEEYITDSGLRNSSTKLSPKGTLLMAMYGQGVTRGRVALLGVSATYNQACCGIQFKNSIVMKYAFYFFTAAYSYIRDDGNETSQMNLSTGYISTLKILCPSLQEQTAIVTHIETQSAKIDQAIAIQQQQIDKLKEYKTTLINSAVTGKIRVPEVAA